MTDARKSDFVSDLFGVPALKSYLKDIGAEPRSLLRAVVTEREGGYRRDVATIKVDRISGEVTVKTAPGIDPAPFQPSEEQRRTIALEVARANWPEPKVTATVRNAPPMIREAKPDDLFEFRDADSNIIMLQVRRDGREGKSYVPFTYWTDSQWRMIEPDGPLPLWGADQLKTFDTVFLHEGAKAARTVRRIIEAQTPDQKSLLTAHPWGRELQYAAHVGWIGGALSPHRTDWAMLKRSRVRRVIIAADNDEAGHSAVPMISEALNGTDIIIDALRFDERFPIGFDLADAFPADMFVTSQSGGRAYAGPSFNDCLQPATWATRLVPPPPQSGRGGQPKSAIVIRKEFTSRWVIVLGEGKPLFIGDHNRTRLYSEEGFNNAVRALSHTDRTSTLFKAKAYSSQVSAIAYEPGDKEGFIIVEGVRSINTWVRPRIQPMQGDVTPWLEFLAYLFPDEEDRLAVMAWIATLIARPRVRMKYGLLLSSILQGVGKTTLCEVLRVLVGEVNCSAPSAKDVVESQFNTWIVRKRLVFVNEIYEGGSWKAYQRLKSYMTDETLEANEKMIKQYRVKNWAHFILCSNSPAPLRVEDSDRRFLMPRVTEEKHPEGKAFWIGFYQWLAVGGYATIAHWAREYVAKAGVAVTASDHAPMTKRKAELIEDSRSPEERAAKDLADEMQARARAEGRQIVIVVHEVIEWLTDSFKPAYAIKPLLVRRWLAEAGLVVPKERVKVDGRHSSMIAATFPIEGKGWPELRPHHLPVRDLTPM